MKTLDRYIIRTFLVSLVLWLVILMSLRIVTDLFLNMDEFVKVENKDKSKQSQNRLVYALTAIGTYYSRQSLVYVVEMGGIIIVAGAAFSIARMNHTNELTAMLASGVSMHRVVWPILIFAVGLGALLVADQEILIPSMAPQLVLPRDDPFGESQVQVRLLSDEGGASWYSPHYSLSDRQMDEPVINVRDKDGALLAGIIGSKARPGVVAGQNGWLVWDASIVRTRWAYMPNSHIVYTTLSPQKMIDQFISDARKKAQEELQTQGRTSTDLVPANELARVRNPYIADSRQGVLIEANSLDLEPYYEGRPRQGVLSQAVFTYTAEDGKVLGKILAESAAYRSGIEASHWELTGGVLFYPSDLDADTIKLRQHNKHLDYMSSGQISDYLSLDRVSNRMSAELMRHIRFADPVNNLVMLLLGLPFVLSRERNIKASTGLLLLMVGAYYAFIYICRYMALPPAWAAWLPILLFGPIAAVMFDSVKT